MPTLSGTWPWLQYSGRLPGRNTATSLTTGYSGDRAGALGQHRAQVARLLGLDRLVILGRRRLEKVLAESASRSSRLRSDRSLRLSLSWKGPAALVGFLP